MRTGSGDGESAREEGAAAAGSFIQVVVGPLGPAAGQALNLPLGAHRPHLERGHLRARAVLALILPCSLLALTNELRAIARVPHLENMPD